jgi:hypothetical protein
MRQRRCQAGVSSAFSSSAAVMIASRIIEPAGLILALRLDEQTNREVTDYFRLPLNEMAQKRINLTATPRSRFAAYRCPTMDDVLRAVMTKVAALPT